MIKRVFNAGHMLVTSVDRVQVKMIFACFGYDLAQMGSLGVG